MQGLKTSIMTVRPAILALAILSSCCHQPCITPPPMATSDQDTIAASIAAQLTAVPVGGSISGSYATVVTNTYDKLTDNDKALYLFLIAIQCYLNDGKVGADIAKSMAAMVQAKWAAKDTPGTQAPTSRSSMTASIAKIDARSPAVAPKIHEILKRVGLE